MGQIRGRTGGNHTHGLSELGASRGGGVPGELAGPGAGKTGVGVPGELAHWCHVCAGKGETGGGRGQGAELRGCDLHRSGSWAGAPGAAVERGCPFPRGPETRQDTPASRPRGPH